MGAAARTANIIFILSDDQGYWTLGKSGNTDIRTPHLDRLAERGTLFSSFFCTSPVCSPARASILTGRIPSQHGVQDWIRAGNTGAEQENGGRTIEYLQGQTSYTDILASHGYCCGISGKWHLGNSLRPQKSFAVWNVHAQGSGPYYNPPMVREGAVYSEEGYVTDIITRKALRFLRERPRQQPFCLNVHYTAPHTPWERHHHPPRLFDDYFEHCRFETFPDLPTHPWQHSLFFPRDDAAKRRELLSGYCTAITAMDEGIGEIVAEVAAQGIDRETLIFFCSDNGMNMGHHGIFGKGNGTFPMNMFDTSVKVPAIVSHPGSIPEGVVNDDLLSQYDILPTFLDYLGIENHDPYAERLPGKSFASPMLSGRSTGNDFVVVYDEYGPVRMVRTREWKYIHRYPYGPHEFYDLGNDPEESINLFRHPEHATRVAELRGLLEQWFRKFVDPERDGVREGVTGRGQVDLVGSAGEGRKAFMDDWRYLRAGASESRTLYSPYDESPFSQ